MRIKRLCFIFTIFYLLVLFSFLETRSIKRRKLVFNDLLKSNRERRVSGNSAGCENNTVCGSSTNEILECSVRDYPYGWGLKGGNTGCCGNYPGCCKFASMWCWAHDMLCMCCGSIWCGPQCRKNPNCDKMLADEAAEGSGEI